VCSSRRDHCHRHRDGNCDRGSWDRRGPPLKSGHFDGSLVIFLFSFFFVWSNGGVSNVAVVVYQLWQIFAHAWPAASSTQLFINLVKLWPLKAPPYHLKARLPHTSICIRLSVCPIPCFILICNYFFSFFAAAFGFPPLSYYFKRFRGRCVLTFLGCLCMSVGFFELHLRFGSVTNKLSGSLNQRGVWKKAEAKTKKIKTAPGPCPVLQQNHPASGNKWLSLESWEARLGDTIVI